MKLICIKDCIRCEIFKQRNKNAVIEVIEIPNTSFGLGDTLYNIFKFFGIKSCRSCKIRQSILNKWFPYFWNKKITKFDRLLKDKILKLGIEQYPVLMNNDLKETIPLRNIDSSFDYITS